MRRVLIGSSVVAALSFGLVTPAGGQELGTIEIDPAEGPPDTEVSVSFVDPGVIGEQCATTPDEVIAQYLEDQGNILPGGTRPSAAFNPGPVYAEWVARGPLVGFDVPDEWPDPNPPFGFPGPPPEGFDPVGFAFSWWAGDLGAPPGRTTLEQDAAVFLNQFMLLLSQGSTQVTEAYLPATYVLTFADIATFEPVGETSNFDPETGEGSISVPDLEAGFYGLAATCVVPDATDESFMAAVGAGAELLDAAGHPVGGRPDIQSDLFAEVAEAMLAELMVPSGGPWVELFCVTDADGECPEDAPDEVPGLNGPVGGEIGHLGAMPAQAVAGDPSLTG